MNAQLLKESNNEKIVAPIIRNLKPKLNIKAKLNINTIGSIEERKLYIIELESYFKKNKNNLSKESVEKIGKNTLRILDSNDPFDSEIIDLAPVIYQYLDEDTLDRYENLKQNLKNENYIFVGQNLIISESTESLPKQSDLINSYHIVQTGENLTEISNKYDLKVIDLIDINNLNNPNSIKVGQKLTIRKKNTINTEKYETTENKKNNDLIELDKKIYGPISIQSKSYKNIKGRKVLNVLNQENKKLILSINCDKNELDVRIPGRKWMGSKPAKEEFENNLINDFC